MSENTVDVLFRTRAELQGARQFADELERQIGKAKALGKDYSELEGQLTKVRAAIKSSSGPTLLDKLGEFAGSGTAKIAAALGTTASAVETLREAFSEFGGAQEVMAQLDAALAQAGQLSEPVRENFQQLAETLEDLTNIPNEKWLSVLTRLTQFGAKPDNIEQYADAVKNLAGIMNGDVQGAAEVFSKAMQGSFELLSRYGIHVDASKTKTEQLKEVMEQLALRGGGQLEARANTLNGSLNRLKNGASDLLKGFGSLVFGSDAVQNTLGRFADALSAMGRDLGNPIERLRGLTNAAVSSAEALDESALSSDKLASSQSLLASAMSEVDAGIDRQIQKADEQFRHDLDMLEKRKQLELARARLEQDPERRARLETGVNTAFGDAKNLLSNKASSEKLAAIDREMTRTRTEVEDFNDELRQLQEALPKVKQFRADQAEVGNSAVRLEKAQQQLDEQEKRIKGMHIGESGREVSPEEASALKDASRQREWVEVLKNKLAVMKDRAQDSHAAIPGLGLEGRMRLPNGKVGNIEDFIEQMERALNELIGHAAPRLDALQRQRDSLTGDRSFQNQGRAIERQTEKVQGQGEINKAQQERLEQKLKDSGKGFTSAIEQNTDTTVAVIAAATDRIEEQNAILSDALQRLALLESRTANLRA